MSGTMETGEILGLLDLTLLDREADEVALEGLCNLANKHRPAAVCVFPELAPLFGSMLDDGIALAVVAGGFPEGSSSPEGIADDVRAAVSSGAEEVDCVLEPRDEGDFPGEAELAKLIAMREGSQGCLLKVIVEAPLLGERGLRAVTRMALATGADFVKTCTGKRGICSDEAARIIAYEISRHCLAFDGEPGLKLSGGVSSKGDAERLIGIVSEQDQSISGPARLRIGSSALLGELID